MGRQGLLQRSPTGPSSIRNLVLIAVRVDISHLSLTLVMFLVQPQHQVKVLHSSLTRHHLAVASIECLQWGLNDFPTSIDVSAVYRTDMITMRKSASEAVSAACTSAEAP